MNYCRDKLIPPHLVRILDREIVVLAVAKDSFGKAVKLVGSKGLLMSYGLDLTHPEVSVYSVQVREVDISHLQQDYETMFLETWKE